MLTIRLAALALIVLLSACNQSDPSQTAATGMPVQSALAQCGKDTDCKGDRVCDNGTCTAPTGTSQQPLTQAGDNKSLVAPTVSVITKANSLYFPLLKPNGKITLGRCHMGSCSWAKWLSVKSVGSSGSQEVLEATLLGGDSEHEEVEDYPSSPKGVAINWSTESHTVKVTCSHTEPSVSTDVLSLNPETGVPGVQESAAELYFAACHSHFDGYPSGIEKFAYNVKEQES